MKVAGSPASPQVKYFLYILYSPSFKRTYTGQTDNLNIRLTSYNSGKVKSTKPYKPWTLIYSESFDSRAEAMEKEKWFIPNQEIILKLRPEFLFCIVSTNYKNPNNFHLV